MAFPPVFGVDFYLVAKKIKNRSFILKVVGEDFGGFFL